MAESRYTTKEFIVQEETIKTGGHYQAKSIVHDVPAQVGNSQLDISFLYPISLLSAEWIVKSEHDGDTARFLVAPDTVIGALTADVSGGNIIDVSQTVVDNVRVGYLVKIDDGTNADDLGIVKSIDTSNLKLTMENNVVNSFLAASPTYVKQTICMVNDFYLVPGRVQLGESKIGGSYIPANTVLRLIYNNASGAAKKFAFALEYLY